MNRIQKLIMTEYSEFEDVILIESPSAQVSLDGTGIRSVQIGLTPINFIIAADNLPDQPDAFLFALKNSIQIDPETETLELLAVISIDLIRLSTFCVEERQLLKVKFCSKKVYYFEFGGFQLKNLYWNIWTERISKMKQSRNKFICGEYISSQTTSSETVENCRTFETKAVVHKSQVASNSNWRDRFNSIRLNPISTVSLGQLSERDYNHRKGVLGRVKGLLWKNTRQTVSCEEGCQEYLVKSCQNYGAALDNDCFIDMDN